MDIKFVEVMGYKVLSDELSKIPMDKKGTLVSCINPRVYSIATRDRLLEKALKNSDFLVLDGVYFAIASIVLKFKNIKKNQGPDVFEYYINYLNAISGRVFFLGASWETINKIKERAKIDFPKLTVDGHSPPYKPEFSEAESKKLISIVNQFKPDVLFVGMTAPKQEKWSYTYKDEIDAQVICPVGAVFDWYAGNEKKINPIWFKLRLVWLIRTIHRPEILKRYPDTFLFFWHIVLTVFRIKNF